MRKNKNVIFIGLVSTGLLLAGCGSSDDSYYDDFNTVDPNPTDPEPSDPVLSETEKAEANRRDIFFKHGDCRKLKSRFTGSGIIFTKRNAQCAAE